MPVTPTPATDASWAAAPAVDSRRRVHASEVSWRRSIRPVHEAGLVDTWEISVIPTVLGGGIPLFPPTTRGEEPLTLLGTRTFKSGVVELRYAPRRAR